MSSSDIIRPDQPSSATNHDPTLEPTAASAHSATSPDEAVEDNEAVVATSPSLTREFIGWKIALAVFILIDVVLAYVLLPWITFESWFGYTLIALLLLLLGGEIWYVWAYRDMKHRRYWQNRAWREKVRFENCYVPMKLLKKQLYILQNGVPSSENPTAVNVREDLVQLARRGHKSGPAYVYAAWSLIVLVVISAKIMAPFTFAPTLAGTTTDEPSFNLTISALPLWVVIVTVVVAYIASFIQTFEWRYTFLMATNRSYIKHYGPPAWTPWIKNRTITRALDKIGSCVPEDQSAVWNKGNIVPHTDHQEKEDEQLVAFNFPDPVETCKFINELAATNKAAVEQR